VARGIVEPAADCEKVKGHVPWLLHIPLVLFMLIRKEVRLLMPGNQGYQESREGLGACC
jgi:hypothetical protein